MLPIGPKDSAVIDCACVALSDCTTPSQVPALLEMHDVCSITSAEVLKSCRLSWRSPVPTLSNQASDHGLSSKYVGAVMLLPIGNPCQNEIGFKARIILYI
jgi:hypothetical protein